MSESLWFFGPKKDVVFGRSLAMDAAYALNR